MGTRGTGVRGHWVGITLVVVTALLTLSALRGDRGLTHLQRLRAELDDVNQKNSSLGESVNDLWTRVHRVREDDAFLERLARRKLDVARPGEIVLRVPPQALQPASPAR